MKLDTAASVDEPDVGCVLFWGIKDDSNIFAQSNWGYHFLTRRKLWKNKFDGGGDGKQELSLYMRSLKCTLITGSDGIRLKHRFWSQTI